MPDLIAASLPFLLPALLPGLVLLLAPLLAARGRTVVAAAMLVVAGGFVVDVLVIDHSDVSTLEVPNVFPRGDGSPHTWIVARESAPHWHWHVFVAAMLATAALVLLLRRRRSPGVRHPILHAALVFWFYLALRLGLEKCAADVRIIWAAGATPALLLILPFFGYYCGSLGVGFGRFVGSLLLLGWLQRLPLVLFGYVASTQQLGTHLDTHLVTELGTSWAGERTFGGDAAQGWFWLTLVPHFTFWVVFTVIAGVLLGFVPWRLAKRSAGPQPAATPRTA
jgi:hypothetical protein